MRSDESEGWRNAWAIRAATIAAVVAGACGGSGGGLVHDRPLPGGDGVVERMHGVRVADPFRWLEDGAAPAVDAWTDAQNARTAAHLDTYPRRGALRQRLERALRVGWLGRPQLTERWAFWRWRAGDADQPSLMVTPLRADAAGTVRPAAEPRTLLDVSALSDDGTTALDWAYPSPSGDLVAYGLSTGGDERSTLHVLDTASGEARDIAIPGTRACSLAWHADEGGFFYTRYPIASTRHWPVVADSEATYHRQVYSHRFDRHWKDDPRVFGAELPKEAWATIASSPDGQHLVAVAYLGWTTSHVWVRDAAPDAPEAMGADPEGWDSVIAAAGQMHSPVATNDALLLLTDRDAPSRRVVSVPWPHAPQGPARWRDVLPAREDRVVESLAVAGGKTLVVEALAEAASQLLTVPLPALDAPAGRPPPVTPVALGADGSLSGLTGHPTAPLAFAVHAGAAKPPTLHRLDLTAPHPTVTTVADVPSPVDPSAFEVSLWHATSADGTRVSYRVTRKRGLALDGQRPTVLYGYGGFGIALTPTFRRHVLPFLEAGGVWVVSHLRGGAEYGEAWHKAGMLGRKHRVFEDFEAVAADLVARGVTRPERLAVLGGSNGGLLTAAAVTRFPARFRAAVSQVPLTDMLRFPRFLIARLWIPEYGDPEDPEAFEWLRAYSPYHHVPEPYAGPAVLVTAAENDTRVDPLHARKFAAMLQSKAAPGSAPLLLRIERDAGHGQGKPVSKSVDELTDVWSFLAMELGIQLPAD